MPHDVVTKQDIENARQERLHREAVEREELKPCEVHALWENCECWRIDLDVERVRQQSIKENAKAEELRALSKEKRALLKNVDEFRTAVARMAQRIDDSELQAIDRAALTDALAGIVISVGMEELVGGW